ncbi:hypothetical protein ACLB2K_052809 [Fragaria x ananassa]
MDKSWIDWGTRCCRPYYDKLDEFLIFASASRDMSSRIYCPCRKCENRDLFVTDIVREHLRDNGFWKKYKIWDKHGESRDDSLRRDEVFLGSDDYMDVDMVQLVQETCGNVARPNDENDGRENPDPLAGPNESTKEFLKLMKGANQPLYPAKITEEVTKKLQESFEKKFEDAIRMLQAQIANNMDSTGGRNTNNAHAMVPTDATSGHEARRESIGEGDAEPTGHVSSSHDDTSNHDSAGHDASA